VQGFLAVVLIGYVIFWTADVLFVKGLAFGEVTNPNEIGKLKSVLFILAPIFVVGLLFLLAAIKTRLFIRERFTPDD
jgi:hypothetical protein